MDAGTIEAWIASEQNGDGGLPPGEAAAIRAETAARIAGYADLCFRLTANFAAAAGLTPAQ